MDTMVTTRVATATSEVCHAVVPSSPSTLWIERMHDAVHIRVEGADWSAVRGLLGHVTVRGATIVVPIPHRPDDEAEETLSIVHTMQVSGRESEIALRQAEEARRALQVVNASLRVQRERLQRVNQDLEMISAAVAHDLRQPLHAIRMFASVLERSPDAKPEIAQRIGQSAKRMGGMLEGLMKLAQIGNAEPNANVRVSEVLESTLIDLTRPIQAFGARVDLRGDATLRMGEAHLRTVLQNLVNNAIKYHREGVPPRVEVRVAASHHHAVIDVLDNGRGVDGASDRLTRLFERMERDSDREGAGVGLALVHRIVGAYGGQLSFHPRADGPGSRFRVELPVGVTGRHSSASTSATASS